MLTDAQLAVKRAAGEFARRELGERGVPESFDREGWRKCAAYGALGVTVPQQYGGAGQTLLEFAALLEGLGYGSRRLGLIFAVAAHVLGAVEPLRAAGDERQKLAFLPKLASGEWIAAHAVTEPGGGSSIASLATGARRAGDDWIVDGVKHCITCGAAADMHVVYARTGAERLSCFLIEPGTPGITSEPMESAGLAGCGLARIAYEGVRVPQANMLGREGAGSMLFQSAIERERACIMAFALGTMERELESAVRHANERVVGGATIASRQAVAHRIADMKLRLESSRSLLYRATSLKAEGKRAPLEAAMAKLHVSECFLQNSIDLVRIHGGIGYSTADGPAQLVADALGGLLFSGTNDIQRNVIAQLIGLNS
jgi:alkylation response protein AidB-like acyl-CoA dehydrogenase